MVSSEVLAATVRQLLGRDPVAQDATARWSEAGSAEDLIKLIAGSEEFIRRTVVSVETRRTGVTVPGGAGARPTSHLCPATLTRPSTGASRILFVGQCLFQDWSRALERMAIGYAGDHVLFNNAAELPELPTGNARDYLFQIVQVPLRTVIRDGRSLNLDHADREACAAFLRQACDQLPIFIEAIMKYNVKYGMTTFFCNFLVPQANLMGRLLPRYDERNTVYFYEKLNEHLDRAFAKYGNAHLFDINNVANVLGKRSFQDDTAWVTSHGGLLDDFDHRRDQRRLERPEKMSTQYKLDTQGFIESCLLEAFAMSRTLAQSGSVKMVVTDLDDTLWRGVIGDEGAEHLHIEGWPLGYIEALNILRRRGILLAMLSKNTDEIVEKGWQTATKGFIHLKNFAVRRVNWATKVENMAEILAVTNLLPRSVVYIDDNPVERAAMAAAYPDMRILGDRPYHLRRDLLWSAETQVAALTAESANRTEMIQAQAERETTRKALPKEEFLATLNIEVRFAQLDAATDPRFQRCFELINKTNQFNTTGTRWTPQMCSQHFAAGGRFVHFSVKDIYTDYGLVGVLIVRGAEIVQFVMSCRVVGLDVERAAVCVVLDDLAKAGFSTVSAAYAKTDANALCKDLYASLSFREEKGVWVLASQDRPKAPAHIAMTMAEGWSAPQHAAVAG